MDSFKIGLFEVLGAIIPGIPVSFILVLLVNNHGLDYKQIEYLIESTNTYSIVFFIVLSYAIGFALQYHSYECFKMVLEEENR